MSFRAAGHAYLRSLASLVLPLTAFCAGCQTPPDTGRSRAEPRRGTIDATKVEVRDDVFQIVPYWVEPIWLQRRDRIVGFKATVYFRSAESNLGTFVSGDIYVWVYELVPAETGGRERKLAHVWQFNQAEAMGYRVRKRSIQGYYYGFPLTWPADLALEGKWVEIELGYERADKSVILSESHQSRVPVPAGYRPPAQKTER